MNRRFILVLTPIAAAALVGLTLHLQKQRSVTPVGQGTADSYAASAEIQPGPSPKVGNQAPGRAVAGQAPEDLAARLKEIKASVQLQLTQEVLPRAAGEKASFSPALAPKISAVEFIGALGSAVSNADYGAILETLEKAPNCTNCVDALKGLVGNQNTALELRRYAAEGLMRVGSKEGVEFVLDQVQAANQTGDSALARGLVPALNAQTSVEGAQALFEFLLGTGRYAGATRELTDELRTALRSSIRLAPDREAVGQLAAGFYQEAQSNGRNDVLLELFDGVSHPNMLSVLAAQAYQQGSAEAAGQFLDRLAQRNHQEAVQALVQVATLEPALMNAAAERLYAWSLQHQREALPGLFLEYLTDSTRSPGQRLVAAYGLVGVENTQLAATALNKVVSQEQDPGLKASLTSLQGILAGAQPRQ